jgi:hypothetical protein
VERTPYKSYKFAKGKYRDEVQGSFEKKSLQRNNGNEYRLRWFGVFDLS